jgi:glycerol-3-phosphate acyltransferase PlsX
MIGNAADAGDFEYIGFVEGGDIPSDRVDVIVTDGFTGNEALKTGEGTATLISGLLKTNLKATPWSMLGALLAQGALKALRKKVDPRSVNGGVFLGLNHTVIKSHGSADAPGVSAAITLAYRLAASGFSDKLAARVASAVSLAQDTSEETDATS